MNKPVKVNFQECTKDEYDALGTYQNNTVYSCYDTGELFKGDIKVSDPEGGGGSGGDSNIFVVEYDSEELTPSKNFSQITEAISQGKIVIAKVKTIGLVLNMCNVESEYIRFALLIPDEDYYGIDNIAITHSSEDEVTIADFEVYSSRGLVVRFVAVDQNTVNVIDEEGEHVSWSDIYNNGNDVPINAVLEQPDAPVMNLILSERGNSGDSLYFTGFSASNPGCSIITIQYTNQDGVLIDQSAVSGEYIIH